MSDERNPSTSGVLLAFMLGGLTGAALAILYAPRSGRETRELLGEKLREGAEKSRDLRERAATKGRELYDEASDFVDKQRDGLEKRKERLAAAIEAGRQAYKDEKENM